jgi:hypothetical protein
MAKESYTDLTAQLDEAIGAEREAHQALAAGGRSWRTRIARGPGH